MRPYLIILFLFVAKCSFAQIDIDNIWGKWYACAIIDSVKNTSFQTFTKDSLSNEQCNTRPCGISIWSFKADEDDQYIFYNHWEAWCKGDNIATANIASNEPWSF